MRILVALTLSLAACKAPPTFQPNSAPDHVWVVPTPNQPTSRRYLQPQLDRDPNRSQEDLDAATKERIRPRSALGVKKTEPRGLLEVTVRFPTGEPYGLGGYIFVYPTGPLDLSLPVWKLQYGEHHDSPWTRLWLPPGEYKVRADSSDYVPSCGAGWTPTLPPFGRTETTLTIRADETTPFEAVLKSGGRIRLTIDDGEGPRLKYAIRLLPEAGPVQPLRFFEHETYPYGADLLCPSGSTCLSTSIIPPGRYTLECESPDKVITRAKIRIGSSRVTEVHLKVPPPLNPAPWH